MNAAGHVWRWGALIVLMIIADQLTKWMVLQTPAFNALACLDPVVLCGRIEISSVFDLTMLWNRGVSFGTMQSTGLMRWVLVTPDMHRIHHSVVVQETNSNFGFNLSVWDRMLGTYIRDAMKRQPEIIIGVDTFRRSEEVSFQKLLAMPFRKVPQAYTNAP